VPNDYNKIQIRYSILVRQYALTAEAYKYLQTMKLNTEQNGNIFDPQPSQLRSNIHSVSDPQEPVIGFLTSSSVTEKRIFIRLRELSDPPYYIPYDSSCAVTIVGRSDAPGYLADGSMLPVEIVRGGAVALSFTRCVDCRIMGGVTQKPSYW
jgi:hypothetical protein